MTNKIYGRYIKKINRETLLKKPYNKLYLNVTSNFRYENPNKIDVEKIILGKNFDWIISLTSRRKR